jgi:hypothetical protein
MMSRTVDECKPLELGLGRDSGALGGALGGAGSGSFHGGDDLGGRFGVDAPARATSAFDGWLAAGAYTRSRWSST